MYAGEAPFRDSLANGLRMVITEDHNAPLVAFSLWYGVGSRNEIPGATGISHVVEHMMFKGTPRLNQDEIDRIIQGSGGTFNGGTNTDYTEYHEILPRDKLEIAMAIEAERMQNALFDSLSFERERLVILEERRQRLDDAATGLFGERFLTLIHPRHAYRWPVIGWKEDLERLTLAQAKDYYRSYYVPNNAVVSICGDINTRQAAEMVRRYFGSIPPGNVPPRQPPPDPEPTGQVRFTMRSTNAAFPILRIGWNTVPTGAADFAALQILGDYLDNANQNLLRNQLVEQLHLARNVDVTQTRQRDGGTFTVQVTANSLKDLRSCEKRIFALLDTLADKGIPKKALDRLVQAQMIDLIFNQEGTYRQARAQGWNELLGLPEYVESYKAHLRALTSDSIRAVIGRYMLWDRAVVGFLLPTNDSTGGIDAEGEGNDLQPSSPDDPPDDEWFAWDPKMTQLTPVNPQGAELGPRVKQWTLKNGIRLWVKENHELPIVSAKVRFTAGTAFEGKFPGGTAWMASRLQLRGTRSRDYESLKSALDEKGVDFTPDCGLEYAGFTARYLSGENDWVLSLLSEMIREPRWNQSSYEVALSDLETVRNTNRLNPVQAAQNELMRRVWGADHPYARTSEGDSISAGALNSKGIQDFMALNDRPEEMILVIVGDVDADQVYRFLRNSLGNWNAPGKRPDRAIPRPTPPDSGSYSVSIPGKTQGQIAIAYPGLASGDSDRVALNVLAFILGGGKGSRLGRTLRTEHGWTYSQFARSMTCEAGGLVILTATTKSGTVDSAAEAMDAEIARLKEQPPTADEMLWARNYVVGSLLRGLDTNEGVADALLGLATRNLPPDYYDKLPAEVQTYTPARMDRLARALLSPIRRIRITAGGVR